MPDASPPVDPSERGITITRRFDAPRELVFASWTDPAQFAQWFGERGSRMEAVSMDVRPGGAWQGTMITAGGVEIPWTGVYREVEPPERLVLTLSDRPGEYELLTVTFTDVDGATEMVFRQTGGHLTDEQYGQAKEGWGGFFDRMAELLSGGNT